MRSPHLPAVLLSLLIGLLVSPLLAEEATNYQLNEAHSGGSITGSMSPLLTKAWTYDLGSAAYGSVIAGGKVFVASAGKNTGSGNAVGQLTALNAQTGRVIWGPVSLTSALAASTSPAYESGRVFTLTYDGTLQGFDAQTGLPLWTRTLPGYYSGYYDPPASHAGVLYVAGSNGIFAVDEVTGKVKWNTYLSYAGSTAPTVSDDGVYLGYDNLAYKLDPATGNLLWTYRGNSFSTSGSRTVLFGGQLYLPSVFNGNSIIDAASGQATGSFPNTASPAFALDAGYFVNQGSLERRDLLATAAAWSYAGDNSLVGSALYLNGYLYIASSNGTLFGVDAADGHQVYLGDLKGTLPVDSSYAVGGMNAAAGTLVVPVANTVAGFTYTVIPVPLISSTATGQVTGRSASIAAAVNPNGLLTTAHVEYGASTNYGLTTVNQSLGSGTSPVPFSDALSSLTPGQTYHYRVVANNSAGVANGPDQLLLTGSELAPSAQTALPSASSPSSATVNGLVNPNGLSTQAYFEFGPNTDYGSQSVVQSLAGLNQWLPLSATFTGLEPNTTYHYRVTAVNRSGVSFSEDQAFLTPPPSAPTVGHATLTESTAGVVLDGSVNPNGTATTYHFEYWHYYETHQQTADVSVGAGSAPVAISAQLPASVSAGTLYFQIVATNSADTTRSEVSYVNVLGKAYLPSATTGGASPSNNNAVVEGTITSSQNVTVSFDYGQTTAYGLNSGVFFYGTPYYANQFVSATLAGLQPQTTYHYRTVIKTGYQTAYGADATFTTSLYSAVVQAVDDLVYTSHGKPVSVFPLDNDIYDYSRSTYLISVGQGAFGTAVADESGFVTYSPGKQFKGLDVFTYTIGNDQGEQSTANVVVRSLEASLSGRYTSALGSAGSSFSGVGQISISVTSLGSFTGTLRLGSSVWPLRGSLTDGGYTGTVKAPHLPSVDLTFSIDPTTSLLAGSLDLLGDEQFFGATRAVYSTAQAASQKGRYTLALTQADAAVTAGTGYATINITAAGAVTVVGKFLDGRALSSSSYVDPSGAFPFYALLSAATHQSVAGVLMVEGGYYSDLDGVLSWISPDAAAQAENGVSFEVDAIGSTYLPPARGETVLPYDPTAEGNTFVEADYDSYNYYSFTATLTKRNTFVPTDPAAHLSLKVNATTGLLSGGFPDPVTHAKFTFGGVVFQTRSGGYGFFRNATGVQGRLLVLPNY